MSWYIAIHNDDAYDCLPTLVGPFKTEKKVDEIMKFIEVYAPFSAYTFERPTLELPDWDLLNDFIHKDNRETVEKLINDGICKFN